MSQMVRIAAWTAAMSFGRIILNLDDSPVPLDDLARQFADWPIDGLEQVIVIRDGNVIHFWP